MTGIYIHVPFCKRKCPYCDFYSVCRPELYEDYTQAVCRNIEAFKGRDIKCDTIYFGGGTPSVLSAEQRSLSVPLPKQYLPHQDNLSGYL